MARKKKADLDAMGELHGLMAESLLDLLQNGRVIEVLDKETGEMVPRVVRCDAATLNQIRQFLKDNGIEVDKARSNKLRELKSRLPSFDDDNVVPFPLEGSVESGT